MAIPKYPKPGDNLLDFIASNKHAGAAEIGKALLASSPQLEVRKAHYPKGNAYTCWYVSIKDFQDLPIINFTLQGNSALNVEFRYMQFINPKVRESLQWQTNNWVYARISASAFTPDKVKNIITAYVPMAQEALNKGSLKRGGTSAAETIIKQILQEMGYSDYEPGIRPEWLRNQNGNLLQLDFWLKGSDIAIEVQGPHHSKDFFGKPGQLKARIMNDTFKVKKCIQNGLSMIWMDSEGIQKELARMTLKDQIEHLRNIIKYSEKNRPCYIQWKSPYTKPKLVSMVD